MRAWADANYPGKWAAFAARVKKDPDFPRRLKEQMVEKARGLALWSSLERLHDESLYETLGLSLPPHDGETPDAYDERRERAFEALRARLERPTLPRAAPLTTNSSTHAGVPARSVRRQVTRSEVSDLRRKLWASERRGPTPEEIDALALTPAPEVTS